MKPTPEILSRSTREQCSASVLACVPGRFRKRGRMRYYFFACSCSQIFDQLQYLPAALRGDSSGTVMCSAVLPFVALLEQTAQLVARVAVQIESGGGTFRVDHVGIDAAGARRERCLHANCPGSFCVIFSWRHVTTAQLVHQISGFMLQRSDTSRLAVIDSRPPYFPDAKRKECKERN